MRKILTLCVFLCECITGSIAGLCARAQQRWLLCFVFIDILAHYLIISFPDRY